MDNAWRPIGAAHYPDGSWRVLMARYDPDSGRWQYRERAIGTPDRHVEARREVQR